jgi:hypothetical protein
VPRFSASCWIMGRICSGFAPAPWRNTTDEQRRTLARRTERPVQSSPQAADARTLGAGLVGWTGGQHAKMPRPAKPVWAHGFPGRCALHDLLVPFAVIHIVNTVASGQSTHLPGAPRECTEEVQARNG